MEMSTSRMTDVCTVLLHIDRNISTSTINRRCAAVFGLNPKMCVYLWYHLEGLLPDLASPKHMLWVLSCLKLYEVEESRASRLQVDEKPNRKWTKIMTIAVSKLDLVCY